MATMFRNDWSVNIGVETEKLEQYDENGFCPIHLGDCIAGRFTILHKLGHGGFGTVWLVRDSANRHGRYVALKVVAAAYSEDYEPAEVVDRIKKHERDHGNPGVFLVELERLFHTSRNGRHLCQVFPVLGPPLSSLNVGNTELLYPIFVRSFARQLASGLAVMHSLGVCHGDFTMKNLAIRLGKSLDHLTEQQLLDIFGRPRRRLVDEYFIPKPSPGPQYVVAAANLTLLPVNYFSTKICILDFDEAFLTDKAPRYIPGTPAPYLAPESIFALTNGPAADVWALGCVLFNLRYPLPLFWNMFGSSNPEATAGRHHLTLGELPEEWMSVRFLDGWPVHEGLDVDATEEPMPIRLLDESYKYSLERWVDSIKEPRCSAGTTNPRTGLDFFCLHVPPLDMRDKAGKKKFQAENTPPIKKEDAKLFTDLLRKIFQYDHTKRITASQVLEHPWMQETGQEPGNPRDVVVDPHDTSVPLQTSFDQTEGCSSATSGSEDGRPIFQSSMETLDLGGLCLKEKSSASGREAGALEEGQGMGKELQKHSK